MFGIGDCYYHVIMFWVNDDDTPGVELYTLGDDLQAARVAALGIKGKPPTGFVIVERQGDSFAILDTYKPLGGTHRFDVCDVGSQLTIRFDGVCLMSGVKFSNEESTVVA